MEGVSIEDKKGMFDCMIIMGQGIAEGIAGRSMTKLDIRKMASAKRSQSVQVKAS